ncbi:MAG: hypothetical protein FWH06_04720 [Oscillospiraceae bacterium]|nr:hypothetical protein [Oscillospiraceae bacterium]
MYINLLKVMEREGVTAAEVAEAAGVALKDAERILLGGGSFSIEQAFGIRRRLFEDCAVGWLFETAGG